MIRKLRNTSQNVVMTEEKFIVKEGGSVNKKDRRRLTFIDI